MAKVIYVSASEKVKELEKDLAMYKKHLEIDIQDDLTTKEAVEKAINLIDETSKEIEYWKSKTGRRELDEKKIS